MSRDGYYGYHERSVQNSIRRYSTAVNPTSKFRLGRKFYCRTFTVYKVLVFAPKISKLFLGGGPQISGNIDREETNKSPLHAP